MRKNSLLAIDPGTLHLGYAHFDNRQLVDFGVRDIRQGNVAVILAHVEQIVDRQLSEKRPSLLVFERNQFSQLTRNDRVVQVIARMQSVAKRRRIPTIGYNARTVRRLITGNGNARKAEAARAVAAKYPETRHYLKGRNATQERYFGNAFDAIACGLAHIVRTQEDSRRWLDRFMGRSGGKR